MTGPNEGVEGAVWRKLAALTLGIVAVGLPVNNISDYGILLVLTVVIWCGEVSARPRAWVAALAVVALSVALQIFLSPPRVEEGHNVFLPSATLEKALPRDVYRVLLAEFDALYPPAKRCDPKKTGCWQNNGFPDTAFAFSADGIWHKTNFSRAVSAVEFSDPVWLRLGFINEARYNWTAGTDVERATRDRRFWMGWKRWHLTMPWYEMIVPPGAYIGGELCWRGTVMWEGDGEHFTTLGAGGCRTIQAADAGRRIAGIAIKPGTLAMHLMPPAGARWMAFMRGVLLLATIAGLIAVLVSSTPKRIVLPVVILALSALIIAVDDASFLGAVRPFDGGDDGLFYDGVGRLILQKLLAGDFYGAFEGGEKVFYYGGPGLRYFRALEHIFFGESYLGYLTIVLLLPFLVYRLFRRFLSEQWSLATILIFVAIPVGTLFGTSFVQYEQWASRGFADPAAYIFFIAGIMPIVGGIGERRTFWPAFFGALLLALGIFMKPIVAPAAAVLLAGAGIAAMYLRQWPRLAGLCVGFLPVFSMALHNWVYGHVFVLFSANAQDSNLLVMPPSAYFAAAKEVITLNFTGDDLRHLILQLAQWLSGPAESLATIPVNAAGIVILLFVVVRGRQFDPWLRLIGASALAQHAVALFYNAATARYHFLSWFLTMLVAAVWLERAGIDRLKQRYPDQSARFAAHPCARWLASGLNHLQKASA
jgi:hypothetical protein